MAISEKKGAVVIQAKKDEGLIFKNIETKKLKEIAGKLVRKYERVAHVE